jgi:inhibitor of KinA sporulation pathway (predicted exonuclease)
VLAKCYKHKPTPESVPFISPFQKKKIKMAQAVEPFEFIIVLDFEATCWKNKTDPEIIEFPSVVINVKKRIIVDSIEQFVKPVRNPKLSEFCINLTSIKQTEVDGGMPLKEALFRHYAWSRKYSNSVLCTMGSWDLKTALPNDAERKKIKVKPYYKQWINLKTPFESIYRQKKASMTAMLAHLNMPLDGTHHRGIDDCKNIAKIAIRMLADGWLPKVTDYF